MTSYNDDLTSYYKLDFSSAAIDHTTATDLNFAAPTITDPTTGQTYDTYRIRYTGSIDVAADGVYFFRAPSADGVILDIDQKHVLFAASIVGDADLNGTVNTNDMGLVSLIGTFNDHQSTHTWQEGDWTGDGYVNASDFGWISAFYTWNHTVTAGTIDNTQDNTGDGGLGAGVFLTAGRHDFQYDYLAFNGGVGASSPLRW